MSKPIECPGCGDKFEETRAALSRFDNKTKVCSECGTFEAMVQIDAMFSGYDASQVLTDFGIKNRQAGTVA